VSTTSTLSRDDRTSLYFSIGIAGFGAAVTAISAVTRLVQVAPGHDIPVTIRLEGESVGLPLGPNGAVVPAQIDTATVTVADPAPATLFALWAQPIWLAVCVIAGLVIAAVFFAKIARGQIFSGSASRLAGVAAMVVALGWGGTSLLTAMVTNGTLAAMSDHTYEAITFQASWVPFLAILLLGALATALKIGERLQRDTEGLV